LQGSFSPNERPSDSLLLTFLNFGKLIAHA